jgi:hypothetical protein
MISDVPKGPSDNIRVRQFADQKLRMLQESRLMSERSKYSEYMSNLTSELLGVSPALTAAQSAEKSGYYVVGAPPSASGSKKSGVGDVGNPKIVTAEMRMPSNSGLDQLRSLRESIAVSSSSGAVVMSSPSADELYGRCRGMCNEEQQQLQQQQQHSTVPPPPPVSYMRAPGGGSLESSSSTSVSASGSVESVGGGCGGGGLGGEKDSTNSSSGLGIAVPLTASESFDSSSSDPPTRVGDSVDGIEAAPMPVIRTLPQKVHFADEILDLESRQNANSTTPAPAPALSQGLQSGMNNLNLKYSVAEPYVRARDEMARLAAAGGEGGALSPPASFSYELDFSGEWRGAASARAGEAMTLTSDLKSSSTGVSVDLSGLTVDGARRLVDKLA